MTIQTTAPGRARTLRGRLAGPAAVIWWAGAGTAVLLCLYVVWIGPPARGADPTQFSSGLATAVTSCSQPAHAAACTAAQRHH